VADDPQGVWRAGQPYPLANKQIGRTIGFWKASGAWRTCARTAESALRLRNRCIGATGGADSSDEIYDGGLSNLAQDLGCRQ
jgi:hypothetical protein